MSWLDKIRNVAAKLPELKRFHLRSAECFLASCLLLAGLAYWLWPVRPPEVLLNVAFDAAQPLFEGIDAAWQEESGLSVSSLHAGSVQQSRALAQGLVADTICMASACELDSLTRNGRRRLVAANWRDAFPGEASPFHSVVVFLVRKEAEDRLQDWPDLFESGLRYALPSPDVSGGGQHAYLALAYSANQYFTSSDWVFSGALDQAVFFSHGARRATERFLRDRSVHALITWESEALRVLQTSAGSGYALVYPRLLLRIDPVVAIAEAPTQERGTGKQAQSYLRFLFSSDARSYIEAAGFRPSLPEIEADLTPTPVSTEALFGSWA